MIHVLPGMGADHRMYPGPWRQLPGAVFLDWPQDAATASIGALAHQVIERAGIADGDTLIGSSLGGIVACEIARFRRIDHLFLVGSARRKEEVSALLRLLLPVVDLAPLPFLQRAVGKLPTELGAMFAASDPAFIRGMCRAIFAWNGLPEGLTSLHRIHGRADLVIPPPPQVDRLLGGGHLIAMTHASECVQFVARGLNLAFVSEA